MELCTGGELLQRLEEEQMMNEPRAAEIMMKLFRALNHCHAENIIHRDIKPENVMFGSDGEIKFIDFGFAIVQKAKKSKMDIAGTPYYIAPEVLSGKYGRDCDTWSLGVVLYQMLTGLMPFDGRTQEQVFTLIKHGDYKFPKSVPLSEEVKDLISKMLTVDINTRIDLPDAIKHPWFKKNLCKSMNHAEYDNAVALKNI